MIFRHSLTRICLAFAVAMTSHLFTLSSPADAQSDRYELGKRVRRFELAWQAADTELRGASVDAMQQAVKSFFSLQLASAARELDRAYFATSQAVPPDAFALTTIAQRLSVQPVAVDAQTAKLRVKLQAFYAPKLPSDVAAIEDEQLKTIEVKLKLIDANGGSHASFNLTWPKVTEGTELDIKDVSEGDYWLHASIESSDRKMPLPPIQVSLVRDLDSRLKLLENWLKEQSPSKERTDVSETIRLTMRQIVQTLRSQVDGRALETDYPAARLLKFGEALVNSTTQASELLREQARESLWLTLSHNRKSLPVRINMPAKRSGTGGESTKLPVLFAFHGAGGSENMFFETYGAGRLVELASERGWIVVAPRHPLLGMPLSYREMIEVLSHFYPIDSDRVYLVGHSMGAAEVVRQVSLETEAPQAAVALGGGGSPQDTEAYRSTRWWVAAGELDFGRSGARSLVNRLNQIKCRVDYREYPKVEHMVIVQAALDDLFEFLDKVK